VLSIGVKLPESKFKAIRTGSASSANWPRGIDKPSLGEIGRVVDRASRLLRIADLDEKLSVENGAMIALAERLHLIKN
jgi:hypothetical protein